MRRSRDKPGKTTRRGIKIRPQIKTVAAFAGSGATNREARPSRDAVNQGRRASAMTVEALMRNTL